MRTSLKICIGVVLLCCPWGALQCAEQKPNVVLILIDDFGYECVTANGGESYSTPVMDKLAATGVRFEQCHVTPLCTPTRVALMTGMSNRRNYANFGFLDPSQKTFGNFLKAAGYATCVAGKWQLGNGYDGPAHFGFDEYCLWQLNRRPGRYKNPGFESNGNQLDYGNGEYGPDIVNKYALDFIERKKNTPFFLYYPMMLTHNPFDATPDSPDYADHTGGRDAKPFGHFPDMVAYADKLIGKVVAKLEELKLRENTLIIVLGDNGTGRGMPTKFKGGMVLGGKALTTEAGTHVPAIGNWPGHFPPSVNADLIDATDFLPTICEATGTLVPEGLTLDGRSFYPQLRGEKGNPREWIYTWYNPSGGDTALAEYAQDSCFKLYADGRFYSLENDALEAAPLSETELDIRARAAKTKLRDALKQFEGPRPEYFSSQYKQFPPKPHKPSGEEKAGGEN